ncbi:VWA domain-containing protein [Bartonella sp. HY038]|uniref:VWA domain-containing protein n=1 Tax=Bartonella sp. HY038 TaxID=2759660 RepID=UPI0015FC0488|nr:VWA domain-containing protein [Bartonella sp. HY038]
MTNSVEGLRRWRLVLGRYSETGLGSDCKLGGVDIERDQAFDYLYSRELKQRGLRQENAKKSPLGGRDSSGVKPIDWLEQLRGIFPKSVCEVVEGHALHNLGMTELLSDPKTLKTLTPNTDLLRSLMLYKDRANPAIQATIRDIAKKIIEDIKKRLKLRLERAASGRRNRFRRGHLRRMQDFDWRATIRDNLKNYDIVNRRIIADKLRFHSRSRSYFSKTIILCVDQSGSMTSSIIYAAIMASILGGLSSVKTKLVLFDTRIVDMSDQLADPVSVLMSVQLGGGTDIGMAVNYCEQLVEQPRQTIFVLISDFCEGGSPAKLLAAIRRLASAQVTMLGVAALNDDGIVDYDISMAQRLAKAGMEVAALTPDRLADWLGGVISS